MLTTLRQSMVISFSTSINAILYFLQRTPIIKIIFKKIGYEHTNLSRGIVALALLFKIVMVILKRVLILILGFGAPYLLIMDKPVIVPFHNIYWHLFICFYIFLPIFNCSMLEQSKRRFIMVKLMRMNARRIAFAEFFSEWILRFLIEIPLFIFMAKLVSIPVWLSLFMIVSKNLFTFFAESIHIYYYEKTDRLLQKKTVFILVGISIILFLGYYPAIDQKPLFMSNSILILIGAISIGLGLIALYYILTYERFTVIINDANKVSELVINREKLGKEAQFADVKLKDKYLNKEELETASNSKKEGFAYINEIFFKRHQRILTHPIKVQSIVICFGFVTALIANSFIPDFHVKYLTTIKKVFPMFVFALYFMSTSQKATKAMFYNCDISLLHYGFYKSKEAVLATFTERVKYLMGTNLIPASLLSIGLLFIDKFTGGTGVSLLPVAIMIITISVFFSIHNLFLYYMFQPYTTDLSVKNPLYTIFNLVTYFLSYLCLQLKDVPINFLIGMVIITAIYSVMALFLVYRFAPKTFIIK